VSSIIKKIKDNMSKIISCRKEIRSLKNITNKVSTLLFSGLFSTGVLTFIYSVKNKIIYTGVSGDELFIACVFSIIGILMILLLITVIISAIIGYFYKKKEKEVIDKIDMSNIEKDLIYKRSDLEKIIKKRKEISEEVKDFESIYLSKYKEDDKILMEILIACLEKEKDMSLKKYMEYLKEIKINLTKNDYICFLKITTINFIKPTREDFFQNKNELIDLISGDEMISLEDKKLLISRISNKVEYYNTQDLEGIVFQKELLILKKTNDIQEQENLTFKDKKLIIKSI
jgi:hypothetical protein